MAEVRLPAGGVTGWGGACGRGAATSGLARLAVDRSADPGVVPEARGWWAGDWARYAAYAPDGGAAVAIRSEPCWSTAIQLGAVGSWLPRLAVDRSVGLAVVPEAVSSWFGGWARYVVYAPDGGAVFALRRHLFTAAAPTVAGDA
jgi:hypothetical protein